MTEMEAFFRLHDGLEREGPGSAEDVAWAAALAGVHRNARMLDAGCGAGADVPALLAAAPEGHVVAVDAHEPFVERVRAAHAGDPRVVARAGDMLEPEGPFDLIWSAGAVYFRGIATALAGWREALAPGGAVAFSEPCFFVDTPSEGARAFWDGHETLFEAELACAVEDAGYRTLGARRLSDEAWEAYYGPLDARVALLRPGADAALSAALDQSETEAAGWRAHRRETGYLLTVAVPR